MVRKKPKAQLKRYPYLFGCYVDEPFDRKIGHKSMQGKVRVVHYKGHMMLSAEGGPHANRAVWLFGDDIDDLIKILREAKRVWLKSYRRVERHLIRSGDFPKRSRAKGKRGR